MDRGVLVNQPQASFLNNGHAIEASFRQDFAPKQPATAEVRMRKYGSIDSSPAVAWSPNGQAVVLMDSYDGRWIIIDARACPPKFLSTEEVILPLSHLQSRNRDFSWPQWSDDGSCVFQPANGTICSHQSLAMPQVQTSCLPNAADQVGVHEAHIAHARPGCQSDCTSEALPGFISQDASLSPDGVIVVDLVSNEELASHHQTAGFLGDGSSPAPAQLHQHQVSLCHMEVHSGQVHVMVLNLARHTSRCQPWVVAWHPFRWPAARRLYACTDFGDVLWVDAQQHQLLGRWEKSTILHPILSQPLPSQAAISDACRCSLCGELFWPTSEDIKSTGSSPNRSRQPTALVADGMIRAGNGLMRCKADCDWTKLIWSPDGLHLTCVGRACLVVISMVPSGRSCSRVIRV